VNISTKKIEKRRGGRDPYREFFGDEFMDRFGGPGPGSRTQTSLGSGFVIDKDGYILTNRHVIDEADEIQVTLADGRTSYDARLVGKDARTDVALLKIEPKGPLTVVPLGDSDKVEVAEWVMAIGSPFGLGSTVTVGVVSYKGRDLVLGQRNTSVEMIQTDAAINPGNSGGPLVNARGEVVGINTLIMTQTGGSAGVGFAVPINAARQILPQLRETGRVTRGWLGVTIQNVSEDLAKSYKLSEARGALVTDLDERGPAAKAGVEPGDIVLEADGRRIEDNSDLSSYISSLAPGTSVRLRLFRNGSEKQLAVPLGTFPDEDAERAPAKERRGTALGMTLRDLTPQLAERLELPRDTRGVVVMDVEAGQPAERAGLAHGDVIVSVNGNAVQNVDELEAEIERARPDGLARLRVRRGTGHTFLIIRLK
jgi:serine protease Do